MDRHVDGSTRDTVLGERVYPDRVAAACVTQALATSEARACGA
jgi:hypothetical protein